MKQTLTSLESIQFQFVTAS